MRSTKLLAVCSAIVVGMGSMATAATFNFDQDAETFFSTGIADSTAYEGTFDQVYGLAPDIDGRAAAAGTAGKNIDGGITVTASATTSGGQSATPFMDSISDGKVAGLGVCSSGFESGGQSSCSTNFGDALETSDDNIKSPELLTLMFNKTVSLLGLQIRDAGHNLISNTTGALFINGALYDTAADGQVILTGLGMGSIFTFTSNGTEEGRELYLSVLDVTAVPVPASLPLLLAGVAGLGVAARRKKNART